MGRWAEVYTPEQRAAVRRAGAVDGVKAPEIQRRAEAGELYGLAPFHIPISTVRHYVRLEKSKRVNQGARLAELDGAKAADDLRRRTLLIADSMLRDAEQKARTKKLKLADFEQISRSVLRVADQLDGKLKSDSDQGRAKPPLHESNGQGEETGGLVDTLARQAAKPQRRAPRSKKEETQGDDSAQRTTGPDTHDRTPANGGASSLVRS